MAVKCSAQVVRPDAVRAVCERDAEQVVVGRWRYAEGERVKWAAMDPVCDYHAAVARERGDEVRDPRVDVMAP